MAPEPTPKYDFVPRAPSSLYHLSPWQYLQIPICEDTTSSIKVAGIYPGLATTVSLGGQSIRCKWLLLSSNPI